MTTMTMTPCQRLHKETRGNIAAISVLINDEGVVIGRFSHADELRIDEDVSKFVSDNPHCTVYVLKPVARYAAPVAKPAVKAEVL